MCVNIYTSICKYIYVYIEIEKEREKEGKREADTFGRLMPTEVDIRRR